MADAVLTGLEAWKAKAAEGAAPADARLLKTYIPDLVKADGEDSRRLTFTISTGAVDRDRDTLAVDGWDVESYLKNPVLLWAHDSFSLPIGRAIAVVKRASALHATFEFATADLNPLAESVFKMLKAGFLKATSVGFLPQEWSYDEERAGFNFKRQQLLEVSVVPVPSNPQALLEAKDAGIDVGPLRAWAKGILGDDTGPTLPAASAATDADASSEPHEPKTAKAGRVLSSANEGRVKAAREACQKACDHLDEVMAAMPPEDEPTDEGKSAHLSAPRIFVKRSRPVETEAERVARIVREVVPSKVAAEIRRLTGRLD